MLRAKDYAALGILVVCVVTSALSISNYPGSGLLLIGFFLVFDLLLLKGLFYPQFYFETFFYGLFWLGFSLKLKYSLITNQLKLSEAVGGFDFSGNSYNEVLTLSIVAICSVAIAIFVTSRLAKKYELKDRRQESFWLLEIYRKKTPLIWIICYAFLIIIGGLNLYFGIYLRGVVPLTTPPAIIRSLIVWFLTGGFSILFLTFIYWEKLLNRKITLSLHIAQFEAFFSSISILSRAYIVQAGAYFYATIVSQADELKKIGKKGITVYILHIAILFVAGLVSAGVLRIHFYDENERLQKLALQENQNLEQVQIANIRGTTLDLFFSRWVGLEGMMATVSYKGEGWALFKKAIDEKVEPGKTSIYDSQVAISQYLNKKPSQHFITLPGFFAFFYYPKSIAFFVFGIFLISLIMLQLEIFAKYLTGNSLLAAFSAQVGAYKLMHFGYAPTQSWRYFLAFILTLTLVFLIQRNKIKSRSGF